jgi:hypothetical protein
VELLSGDTADVSDPLVTTQTYLLTNICRILSLHFHYAVLYTASPVFLASPTVWHDLAAFSEGYQQLERAREAAFAVIKAICSVSRLRLRAICKG